MSRSIKSKNFGKCRDSTVSRDDVCLQLLLSSDEGAFGGFENLSKKYNTEYSSAEGDYDGRPHSIKVNAFHFCATLTCIATAIVTAPRQLPFRPMQLMRAQLSSLIWQASQHEGNCQTCISHANTVMARFTAFLELPDHCGSSAQYNDCGVCPLD